ncbi:MAG: 30S ribosomal protein S20 [Calditrichales bacterium]|nr:30S ribosomal protein S20 [Ignavibacterium sp.]TFG94482.1 MAG: 30S ribosomal protein S20 [Calditrichales bacterium]
MAHHQSALKRIRTSEKKRQVNRQNKSKLHTLTKAVRIAESKEDGQNALNRIIPFLDKLASNNVIHKNKASNQKSRLTKHVNQLS